MPDYADAYLEALYQARQELGRVRARTLRRLYLEYAAMLIRIDAEASAEVITAARAEMLRAAIQRELSRLAGRLVGVLDAEALRAATLAAEGHAAGAAAASEAAGVPLAVTFGEIPRDAVEHMMRRRGLGLATTFRTLINRNVQALAGDVDALLSSAVARGASSRRTTRELAAVLSRDDPEVLKALESLGARGGRTAKAIREGIEVESGTLKKARTLLYDARRIAVTEVNASFHEADVLASIESDVVGANRWRTSKRHPYLPSSPDICDYFELADLHGLGAGVFPVDATPAHPHPFCQCWLEKVIRPPDEWDAPKPKPAERPPAIEDGDVLGVMRSARTARSRALTRRFVQSQAERARRHVRLAQAASRRRLTDGG